MEDTNPTRPRPPQLSSYHPFPGLDTPEPLPAQRRATTYWGSRQRRGRARQGASWVAWEVVRLAREGWALLRGRKRGRVADLEERRLWADLKAARRELDGVLGGERRAKEVLEGVKKKAIEARRRRRRWRAKPMGEWRD